MNWGARAVKFVVTLKRQLVMLGGNLVKQSFSSLGLINLLLLPRLLFAQDEFGLYNTAKKALPTGTPSPMAIIATVIQIVLSVVGVAAIVLILYGGFQWLTSSGNEEKISQAKKIISGAAVGLAIILSSYIIVNFIFTGLTKAIPRSPNQAVEPLTTCSSPNSCKVSCSNQVNDLGPVDCAGSFRCCAEPL